MNIQLFNRKVFSGIIVVAVIAVFSAGQGQAQVPDWPDLYDPLQFHTFYFDLDAVDAAAIQADVTNNIEVPACFRAAGETETLLVSIRRKSSVSLGGKVAYKIDINEYKNEFATNFPGVASLCPTAVGPNTWKKVKKLSLENGDESHVINEGLAWHMHRLAIPETENYVPGYSAFVEVIINGQSHGVYLNVEQRDKQFMKNHGLFDPDGADSSWLYKAEDDDEENPHGAILKVGDPHSPTHTILCYSPWVKNVESGGKDKGGGKGKGSGKGKGGGDPGEPPDPEPPVVCESPANLIMEADDLVDMSVMLTMGAVNAFSSNPDELFNQTNNYFFVDYLDNFNRQRLYIPWDLDAAIHSKTSSIYAGKGKRATSGPLQDIILGDSSFRSIYNAKMQDLLKGPLAVAVLQQYLTDLEALIGAAVDADANSMVETAADAFDQARAWVADRHRNVQQQLDFDLED